MPRISSVVVVHTNGFGFRFHSLIHLPMSASSSLTRRCAERRSLRLVSTANHRSAKFIQLLLVGREAQVEARVAQQPVLHRRSLVRGVDAPVFVKWLRAGQWFGWLEEAVDLAGGVFEAADGFAAGFPSASRRSR